MGLRDVLAAFLSHRRQVLERRTGYRLARIAARLEILEGYLAVYLNLDKVIRIIRNEDEPKPKLMAAFSLSDVQAEAILNMRLRTLRKLDEMEIKAEHAALSKEQKDLKKLLASDTMKSARLSEEVRAIDARFGLKTALGKRRTTFAAAPEIAAELEAMEALVEREPITVVCSEKGWIRAFKGHQEPSDAVKYREGDRERFWIHAETTDRLMLFATDGRFFTLDCAKLPARRSARSSTCRPRPTS
jgi:topoisomerase-4 subunit A